MFGSFVRARVSVIRTGFLIGSLFLVSSPQYSRARSLQQQPALSEEQQDARDALNQGVAAFKNAQFDQAGELFQRAKQLDPSLQNVSLYLAMAYASQYIPGAPSEENVEIGKMAAREYRGVRGVDT